MLVAALDGSGWCPGDAFERACECRLGFVAEAVSQLHDGDALVRVEIRPALQMERLFEAAVNLAEQGGTMRGGIPKPLDLARFLDEFENEVQAAFAPRWMQRIALARLEWLARRRDRTRAAHEPATAASRAAQC